MVVVTMGSIWLGMFAANGTHRFDRISAIRLPVRVPAEDKIVKCSFAKMY
jgi:hypothetical protein